ncbi:benzoate/H(+) symporter BenE family transporter [Subtercola sp. Z020]|uniref:benzoate/H(+) symporter BenE family transporter n=1 Tax=Subtercola sp. Z020 TaxID=2080582 RepID=UPI001E3A7BEC|nr:benzoate/H(+) symporter BenE family transporter [Subtercola sp. Z020]
MQPLAAGIVAGITGFASSFALVIAGLHAVGASDAEASSGLLALCFAVAILCIVLARVFRMPISFAWSTPGAALLIAASATTNNFSAAVGAFVVCGLLIVLCGLWPALGRAITRIPKSIASAMLAGILFPICLAPVLAVTQIPALAVPVVVVWLVLFRLAPRWAVPAAMLVAAIGIGVSAGTGWLSAASTSLVPAFVFVPPTFDAFVIVSLGLPLFIVTMAGQNVPGFVVMSTFGYEVPPRPVLVASGAATAVGALFGGHAVNLAAITAAIMAGPDSHPDRSRRWVATFASGFVYIAFGLGAGFAVALISASPPILITAVAGLALLGALVGAITSSLEDATQRIPAVATFLVTASGIVVAGVGSAFWGLLTGGLLLLVAGLPGPRRPRP